MDKIRARSAFSKQCWDAKKRGIEILFTFEEWCKWWDDQLGPNWQKMRGCCHGQYVMARYGDDGPYTASNVALRTVAENHQDYNYQRQIPKGKQRRKLSPGTVVDVYLAAGNYAKIAKRFKIGAHQVHCIKTKKYYSNITNQIR